MFVRSATRVAALAIASAAVLGPLAGQAGAQVPYPPSGGGSISDIQPQPGERVTVVARAGEFRAAEQVEVGVQSTYVKVTTVRADSRGGATATFDLPADLEAGNHSAVMTGLSSGNVLRIGFTVAAQPTTASGSLATTGSSSTIPLTVSGVGLSVVGLGIVVAARRRRVIA